MEFYFIIVLGYPIILIVIFIELGLFILVLFANNNLRVLCRIFVVYGHMQLNAFYQQIY